MREPLKFLPLVPRSPREAIDDIINAVCEERRVSRACVMSKNTKRTYAMARRDAAYRIKRLFPNMTNEKLGSLFGRDPSTMSYALKKAKENA